MGNTNKLLILGNGMLANSLAPIYGEELGIYWLGFIADEQKRIDILRSSDVFVLPSLVEGLSLALLEAMSCGLACFATDAGADAEVLKEVGIVLNTQKVFSQLKTLLPVFRDNPELITPLKEKSRHRVLERYTLKRNIDQLESLYNQVLREKSSQE
jgi:glycosyltransferase involved in cell wall biosynthesis